MVRITKRQLLAAGLSAAAWPATSWAQRADYPNKPLRIVVTFPPGGSSDAMLRLLAPRLSERLGQQIVVDNKPGAGGNIGLSLVAKSAPDGYTLGVGAAGGLAANASLYPQMPYETLKDFVPVTMLAAIPFVIVGSPSLQARNLQQLIALAKTQPGKLSVAHGGNGTAMHLSTALFEQMADIKLTQVPYRGSGPAAMDVLSGQVPLGLVDLPASLQHIKAGKLIAYAVTSSQRLPMLPDVPTVSEAALPGYDSTGWFGLVAPAGTPAAIVAQLNTEFVGALRDEAIQNSMRNMGMEPQPSTAEAFDRYLRAEIQKWAGVIRKAQIKLD